mgnify:FL=1
MIDTIIKDDKEKEELFNAVDKIPSIKKKNEWALKWMEGKEKDAPFVNRLIAFAIVEGLFFSSSFASIYWIK